MVRTVLDVTRLLTRASHPVATGVDRVELAYALRALRAPPERVGFAAIVAERAAPLPYAGVARFIRALDARWREGLCEDRVTQRLWERLGAAPPTVKAAAPGEGDARRMALGLRAAAVFASRRAAVAERDVYVHVSHIRLDRPAPFAQVRRAGARLTVMIHDLIPIRFPEYARAGEAERHRRRMTTALDHATTLVANSAATADDLGAFAAEIGRPRPEIVVAPLGVEDGFAADGAPLDAAKPYFVALGTIEPRKNHLLLLHLWRRLAEDLGEAAPTLVLVGRRGWENEMVVDLLERSPAIRANVMETNDLSDRALVALVRSARALLFPSFAEGFGLPLAEALALGAPVIASDLAVFREVAGDAAERLDPLDGPAWRSAVMDYADPTSPRRLAAIARASRFTPPAWDAHFARVAAATGGL